MTKKRGEGNGGGTKMLCPNCGSTVGFTTERRPNGDTECHYCGHKNSTAAFYKSPPEPSTTAEDLAEAFLKERGVEGSFNKQVRTEAYLAGYRARDAEVAELKALLHEEAKDYAETIMKLCEECGVESIQDIGPKLAELKAEHDRLQEDLCEKVVSEGGALEAELTLLRQSLAESERKAAGLVAALKECLDWMQWGTSPKDKTTAWHAMHARGCQAIAPKQREEAGIGDAAEGV